MSVQVTVMHSRAAERLRAARPRGCHANATRGKHSAVRQQTSTRLNNPFRCLSLAQPHNASTDYGRRQFPNYDFSKNTPYVQRLVCAQLDVLRAFARVIVTMFKQTRLHTAVIACSNGCNHVDLPSIHHCTLAGRRARFTANLHPMYIQGKWQKLPFMCTDRPTMWLSQGAPTVTIVAGQTSAQKVTASPSIFKSNVTSTNLPTAVHSWWASARCTTIPMMKRVLTSNV